MMLRSDQQRALMASSVIGLAIIASVEISHVLLWLVVHVYELTEFVLDEAISHVFNTSRETTQIIVFYLMLGMALYGCYWGVKGIRHVIRKQKTDFLGWWAKQSEITRHFWTRLPTRNKFQVFGSLLFGSMMFAILFF
jgi:hypothetical protein